jgi:hypothetical protein
MSGFLTEIGFNIARPARVVNTIEIFNVTHIVFAK